MYGFKEVVRVLFAVSLLAFSGMAMAKQFTGQTLKVLSFRDNHSDAVLKSLKEFEALTGAKVKLDLIASNTVATKTMTDQMAGGSYDLYTVDEPFIPQLSPFFVPLDKWPKTKLVAAKELGLDKYLPAAVAGTQFQGKHWGLPVNSNVYLYIYRRDLFENPEEKKAFKKKYGYELNVPKTVKEFKDVASFFTRPPKLYGFAPFTKKSEGTTVEAIWALGTFGVKLFDDDLNVVMDKKKATEAFQFYIDMMAYAPRGSKSWHHSERMAAYRKGKLVQIMTWPGFLKGLEDPRKSRVVGLSQWGVPPAAAIGQPAPVAGTWALSIPKSSKNKALAATFARWWGSYTFGKTLVPAGMNPARRDLLTDPSLVKGNPWFAGIMANFEQAVVRPRFPEYRKVSDRISVHFTNCVVGRDTPAQAVDKLYKDLTSLTEAIRAKQTH